MRKTQGPMTDVLRQAILDSGTAHIALERATGVKRASIMRFVRGTHSLRLDVADKLAAYFGLELRKAKRKGR
jgi:plasmid maintenance system antidote protein VapI